MYLFFNSPHIVGLSCLGVATLLALDHDSVLQTIFALVGKFGATATFGLVYLYTAELYPTAMRNTAIGCCSTVARVGGVLALLMKALRIVWSPLPLLITGVIGCLAGVLALFGPETSGKWVWIGFEKLITILNVFIMVCVVILCVIW